MLKILIVFLMTALFGVCDVQAAQLNKVAAVVNGQVITMFDLQKQALPEFARARVNPGDPKQEKASGVIFRKVLDAMIMDILIQQEAKRLKLTVSPSELDARIAEIMKERHLTKQQFEAQLAREQLSVAELRKGMEMSLLRQRVMAVEVARRVVVTPEEIKAYYDQHKGEIYTREGMHVGLLVYHPKADAKAISAQIKSGELSFAAACAKYSILPEKDKGADLGPADKPYHPEMEARLAKMKPGDVSDIFMMQKFRAQLHLFRPGGGDNKPLTFEEAKPIIDGILRAPKAEERFKDYSEQLRKKAIIDIRL